MNTQPFHVWRDKQVELGHQFRRDTMAASGLDERPPHEQEMIWHHAWVKFYNQKSRDTLLLAIFDYLMELQLDDPQVVAEIFDN